MRRGISGVIFAVGLVALVAVAWFYLQDRQEAASSPTPTSAGQSASSTDEQSAAVPAPEPSEPNYVAQDAGEGGVKVAGAVLTPGAIEQDPTLSDMAAMVDPEGEIGVMVVFETHSGDLSQLDLVALSSLTGPDGEHKAVRWEPEDDSEHHRSGMLVFNRNGLDLAAATGDLALIMRDVAGVPVRTLTWLLPLG